MNRASYQLREPTADDYLEAIPEVVAPSRIDLDSALFLQRAIEFEMERRFSNLSQQDYAQLYGAYEALSPLGIWLDRGKWNQDIITAWLRQNPVDLNTLESLQFEDYVIGVTPLDFDADGDHEFMLEVEKGDGSFRSFLVARRNGTRYRLVETPLPWFGSGYPFSYTQFGGLEPLSFEDINADGLPEWVLVNGGALGNHLHSGRLSILQWREGSMVDLTPDGWGEETTSFREPAGGGRPILPRDVSWDFANLDDDPALELRQTQVFHDNWQCTFYETRTFDWDETQGSYVFDHREYEFEQSAGCLLRTAQAEMWEENFSEAIQLYERSLELAPGDKDISLEQRQHAQMRLILAHSLAGSRERASQLFSNLQEQEPASELIDALVSASSQVYDGDFEPLTLCVAVYNVFATSDPWDVGVTWGAIMDRPVPMTTSASPNYDSAKAGCDAPLLIDDVISSTSFTTDEPPPDQLSQIGLVVTDYLVTDLNQDGHNEWLVWPSAAAVEPIFFVPALSGTGYDTSRPPIFRLAQVVSLDVPTLNRPLLAELHSDMFELDGLGDVNESVLDMILSVPPYNCVSGERVGRGYLRLWELDDGELHQMLEMPMCEPRSMEELFPDGKSELRGWAPVSAESISVAQAVYRWDEGQREFIPEFLEDIGELTTSESDEQIDLTSAIFGVFEEPDLSFARQGLEEALGDYDPTTDRETVLAAHYLLGILLEAQGESEQALSEYVNVYATVPESAWGKLAALHVQPISDE